MAPKFRKGAEAIAASKKKAESGGNFKPFAPRIALKDGEKKYLLFLTPIEETVTVEVHEFIPIGTWKSKDGKKSGQKFGFYISQKDPAIGGDHDILEDEFGMKPRERTLAVAVELEPVMEKVGKRLKPVGFEVVTETIPGKGEDGEDIETPVIGVVSQSSSNFFGFLSAYDAEEGPVVETPFSVTRDGNDKDTAYHFNHYDGAPVDLAPLIDNVEGILYIADEKEDVLEEIEDAEPLDAAIAIAGAVLDARLEELADGERYAEETKDIEVIKNSYGDDYVRSGSDEEEEEEAEEEKPKKARRTRRSAKQEEPVETTEEDEDEGEEPDADDEVAAKKTRFAEMRKKADRKNAKATA